MVRHESAEALGAIEERWGECECILQKFLQDEDDVVRESCLVALDAADYWGYNHQSTAVDDDDDDDDVEESKCNGVEESEPLVVLDDTCQEKKEEQQKPRTNFSLHKAHSNGKATTTSSKTRPDGVLHNHFNVVK